MPAGLSSAPSDAELAGALRVGVMRLVRRLRSERTTEDLSLNQLAVLGSLHRHGALTVGDLARLERVKPPSMTRTVNCLADAGLVLRRAHETDGRQVVVEITESAQQLLDADRRRRDAWLARRLAELAPDEREHLRRALSILDKLASS